MTYAVGMGPLPDLLEAQAGSRAVERAFKGVHLPLHLVTDRSHQIPLASLVDLFDRAARLSGDPLMGLKIGMRMAPADYGLWVRYVLQAPTLRRAIKRISRALVLHQIGGRFVLSQRPGGLVALRYVQNARSGPVSRQHDDHVLPPLLAIIRSYLGEDWTPYWIESGWADRRGASAREDLIAMPWRAGAEGIGLVFSAEALDRRRFYAWGPDETPISSTDVQMEILHRTAERPIDRVAAIIALRLMDRECDIDGAAHMAGLGRRSLQRMIGDEGTTYRALLEQVRMSRAQTLIAGGEASLTEIAFMTGYSDPAHFTRAFRRHFGVAPSRFRDAADQPTAPRTRLQRGA